MPDEVEFATKPVLATRDAGRGSGSRTGYVVAVPRSRPMAAGIRTTRALAEALLVEADHAGMNTIAELVEAGKLRAEIAGVFPLAEAEKAHELGETGRTAGKLVLEVW